MEDNSKAQLMSLYHDGFPEDSDNFVNYFFDKVYREENVVTRCDGKDIISCAHIVMKKMKYFDKVIDVPYLVAVSTKSELRGRRLVEKVIFDSLKLLHEREYPLVMLYPFKHSYYTKYNFVTIDKSITFEDIISSLDKRKSNDTHLFYDIFSTFQDSHDISIYRTYDDMKARLDMFYVDSDESYILYDNDVIVGYVLMSGDYIEECILLPNYISSIDNVKYQDNVMARLVDIEVALNSMHFDDSTNVHTTLHVIDSFMGDRYISFDIVDGKVHAEYTGRLDNSIPHIDIDIADLTKMVLYDKALPFDEHFVQSDIDIIDKY